MTSAEWKELKRLIAKAKKSQDPLMPKILARFQEIWLSWIDLRVEANRACSFCVTGNADLIGVRSSTKRREGGWAPVCSECIKKAKRAGYVFSGEEK